MHANQKEPEMRDAVSTLFDSLKETERQQAFLKLQLKAALQEKMGAARDKIEAAKKDLSDLEGVWKGLFGEEDMAVGAGVARLVDGDEEKGEIAPVTTPSLISVEGSVREGDEERKKVEASTWRWFDKTVEEEDQGVSQTIRGGLPDKSIQSPPGYPSNESPVPVSSGPSRDGDS
jgi:hypothetical protein